MVSINTLPVADAGTDQTISFGTSTTLDGTASGGSGSYTYLWSPPGSLVNANIEDPTTVNLIATTTFTLIVTDQATNCQGSAQVTVFVNGVPLAANATATPDTICIGQTSLLNANASGGAGPSFYTYLWSSVPAGFSSTLENPSVSPTVTTTYYVTVSDSFNSVVSSVTVNVLPLPQQYEVSGSGIICFGASGLNIILTGSQIGVSYQLQLDGVDIGTPLNGTSAGLVWPNQTAEGVYTIIGTNIATGCSNIMAGSATIVVNDLPGVYDVTGGGVFCGGGLGVNVGLSGSEAGISYQLLLDGITIGSSVPGDGNPIDFGLQTSSGTYTVVATDTSTFCADDMNGSAVITVNPLPTGYNLTGGGEYCSGGTGLTVGLNGSDTGVDYQLYLDGAIEGSPVPGTGSALSFGTFTTPGTFTVIATNAVTSCVSNMSNPVSIIINPLPVVYDVAGGGSYCAGGTGLNVTLSGSETGVTYQLFIDGVATGSGLAGTGNALSFNNLTITGVYTIQATNDVSLCLSDMNGSATIVVNPLPVIDSLYIVPLTSCILNNGEVTIYASNGTYPLTYSMDGVNFNTDSVFTGLMLGNITCYVSDVNNCMVSVTDIVPDSTGFALDSVLTTDNLCNSDSTGQTQLHHVSAI